MTRDAASAPAAAIARGWRAECTRLRRSRLDLILLTLMPAVLLGLMGAMIARGSVRDGPVVIVDHDGGALARAIRRTVDASPMLSVAAVTPDVATAMTMVRSERALAILVIPRGIGLAGSPPAEILYEAQFLAAGSTAQAALRAAVTLRVAEAAPHSAGVDGISRGRGPLPGVRLTLLGNPTASLGWYLGLLLGPAVIHLLFAVSAIGAVAPLLAGKTFAGYARVTVRPSLDLVGRLAPHVLACWSWGTAWIVALTLLGDYRFVGSIWAVAGGLLLLALATVGVALLLIVTTREMATALSAAVIITGSALAYSGASLPINGAPRLAQVWSAALPLTHYIRFEMDVLIGAHPRPLWVEAGALLLYPLIAGGLGLWLVARSARA